MSFPNSDAARAKLALELTMRDALDGLEELASLDVFWFESGCLEILGIDSPCPPPNVTPLHAQPRAAEVLDFPVPRRRTG